MVLLMMHDHHDAEIAVQNASLLLKPNVSLVPSRWGGPCALRSGWKVVEGVALISSVKAIANRSQLSEYGWAALTEVTQWRSSSA